MRCYRRRSAVHAGIQNCGAYANAVASGTADINQCPPGGDETAAALADLLGVQVKPLDPRYGAARPPAVAHNR
jgi:electron transport complex protein RnfB